MSRSWSRGDKPTAHPLSARPARTRVRSSAGSNWLRQITTGTLVAGLFAAGLVAISRLSADPEAPRATTVAVATTPKVVARDPAPPLVKAPDPLGPSRSATAPEIPAPTVAPPPPAPLPTSPAPNPAPPIEPRGPALAYAPPPPAPPVDFLPQASPGPALTPSPRPGTLGEAVARGSLIAGAKTPTECLPEGLRAVLADLGTRFGAVTLISTTQLQTDNHSGGSVRHNLHRTCKAVDFKVKAPLKDVVAYLRTRPEIAGLNTYRNNGVIHVDVNERAQVARGRPRAPPNSVE